MELGYDVANYMKEAIEKYKLKLVETSRYIIKLVGENCIVIIKGDYTGVDMVFKNPKDSDDLVYNPWTYTNLVYGFYTIKTELELSEMNWKKDQDTMGKNYAIFFNSVLLDYFEPVMNGDYSWKDKFVNYITEVRELNNYLRYRSEYESIRLKNINKDITWIDDARALYKKLKSEE